MGLTIYEDDFKFCETFELVKSKKYPAMRKEDIKTTSFGKLISIDIDAIPYESIDIDAIPYESIDIDAIPYESLQGYKYRLEVIENASSWLWTFCLETKGDASTHIEHLIKSLKPDLRQVRVDGGKEFLTNSVKDFCYTSGFELRRSEPYGHAQAEKIEKQHDIIDSMVRAWLKDSNLPKTLWFKASQAAVYAMNRSSKSFSNMITSPYELRYGTKPNADKLKVYGCLWFAPTAKQKRNKLDDNALRCIFIGYSNSSPG
jgi:hypothetical protein